MSILGSALMELLRQSGESLAGRVSYIELPPLNLLEIRPQGTHEEALRGGVVFRRVIWPRTRRRVFPGGPIFYALIWSAISHNSAPAYRPKPCAASGPCWHMRKGDCSMPPSWWVAWE